MEIKKPTSSKTTLLGINEGLIKKGSEFWSNVDNKPNNVLQMVAEVLSLKSKEVWIKKAVSKDGTTLLPDYVAVYATPNGRSMLNAMLNDPRISALQTANGGFGGLFHEPDVNATDWDEATKSRVLALYWKIQAEGEAEAEHRRGDKSEFPASFITYHKALHRLPEGTKFPNNEDIKHIVNQVIEEQLLSKK